jgi:hypothetical protein
MLYLLRILLLAVFFSFPGVLPGCAAGTNGMGSVLLAPDTFAERLAVGYSLVAQVRATATALLDAGKISSQDGQNTLDATDVFRAGLDVARGMAATDLTGAEAKLAAIKTGLTALKTYVDGRK